MITAPRYWNEDNDYPVIDGDPIDSVSVRRLFNEGWKYTKAMISDDGAVIYILVEQDGMNKWLPLRID